MSDNNRSFWSSVPGLVTGLAGLLTGIVGLITLLVQLNVIGGDSKGGSSTATTTPPAAGVTTTLSAGNGSTPSTSSLTSAAASFTASPTKLEFPATDPTRDKTVTIKNTSLSTDLRLSTPSVTGKDADRFTWSYGDCTSVVRPNLSCTLKVTFTPSGALRTYSATLQLSAAGAVGQQVDLNASTLL